MFIDHPPEGSFPRDRLSFTGAVLHLALIPVVVAIASGLVAMGLFPPIGGVGRAIQSFDHRFLGNSSQALRIPSFPERSTIYAADGTPLATLFQDENRVYVPLAKISRWGRLAVLASEDHKFYEHGPVEVSSIVRAAIANLRAGHIVQGASTITQQLIKNTELGPQQTFARKFQEAQDAIRLEHTYTKDQILELYLNQIYLAHQVYGIGTAAQYYFGHSAAKLTLPEAALLAGMLPSPVGTDPIDHRGAALTVRNKTLADMLKYGFITRDQYEQALIAPIKLSAKQRIANTTGPEPYWVSYVVRQFLGDPRFGRTIDDRRRLLFQGGLKVYTTIDLQLQHLARAVIQTHLPQQGPQPPADPQGALATVDSRTGAILVEASSANYAQQKFDLATQSSRSTGSAFKAFTLTAAFEHGMPAERMYDSSTPKTVMGCGMPGGWIVHNAEPGTGGMMNLWAATAASVNVVFAQLIRDVGPENVKQAAASMGIDPTHMQAVCSLTLGTGVGTNPLEMASAYSTLANGGVHCTPYAIAKVVARDGTVIYRAKPDCHQAIPADVAHLVTALLEGVIAHGTGTAAQIGRPEAGKTGTGENYQDAWFMGYIPQLTTGVWVGYSKAEIPMRGLRVLGGGNAFGGTIAAPIWHDFMIQAVQGLPVVDFPAPPPPKMGTVPNVVGMKQADALKTLSAANYSATVKLVDSIKPAGIVVAQSPGGGASAPLGTLVEIDVSNGKPPPSPTPSPANGQLAVPGVVGAAVNIAKDMLQAAGLRVSIQYVSAPPFERGFVLDQSPAAGMEVAPGTVITIVVGHR